MCSILPFTGLYFVLRFSGVSESQPRHPGAFPAAPVSRNLPIVPVLPRYAAVFDCLHLRHVLVMSLHRVAACGGGSCRPVGPRLRPVRPSGSIQRARRGGGSAVCSQTVPGCGMCVCVCVCVYSITARQMAGRRDGRATSVTARRPVSWTGSVSVPDWIRTGDTVPDWIRTGSVADPDWINPRSALDQECISPMRWTGSGLETTRRLGPLLSPRASAESVQLQIK